MIHPKSVFFHRRLSPLLPLLDTLLESLLGTLLGGVQLPGLRERYQESMNEPDVIVPPEAIFELCRRVALVRGSMYRGHCHIRMRACGSLPSTARITYEAVKVILTLQRSRFEFSVDSRTMSSPASSCLPAACNSASCASKRGTGSSCSASRLNSS